MKCEKCEKIVLYRNKCWSCGKRCCNNCAKVFSGEYVCKACQKDIIKAKEYENTLNFIEAMAIYEKLQLGNEIERLNEVIQAKEYETCLEYEEAKVIYEEYEMWDDVERLKDIILEKKVRDDLLLARNYETALKWDDAIEIYEEYGMWEEVERLKELGDLNQAENFEIALRYNDATKIYERYGMWEEAGRCRRLEQQRESPQPKIDIGYITHSTSISDSVIQRSFIGGAIPKKIQICPYCGEGLDFAETPHYCPYCRKQILA